MLKKVKVISLFIFLLLIHVRAYTLLYVFPTVEKKPVVIFRDSYGRGINDNIEENKNESTRAFGLSDSIFGSFFNLEPCKSYHVSITKDDRELTNLVLRSDEKGVITTTALLWNLGFNFYPADGEHGIDNSCSSHKYRLSLTDAGKNPVIKAAIPVSADKQVPYIYTCDKDGNPKKTFIFNKDDVYIKGHNLKKILVTGNGKQDPRYPKLYIYVVTNHWFWVLGDRVDGGETLKQKYVETLTGGALEEPHLIWQKDDLTPGSYDVIASGRNIGLLLATDVIETNYGLGFKVVKEPVLGKDRPGEKEDLVQPLTCQTPPHIALFGNLDQPRDAVYKDYFTPMEQVWVAVQTRNPTPEQRNARKARIYVLKHQIGKPLNDGDPLHDESGGYEEVLLQPQCAHAVFTRVWYKPEISEEGFDVVVDFENAEGEFGTYDKGLDILDNGTRIVDGKPVAGTHKVNGKDVEHGGFYVPKQWVCLESLSLNHTRDTICSDAVTIRYRMNKNLRIPEWIKGRRSFPAAYVKNTRIAVQPGFTSSDDINNAKLKAYARSGSLADIKEAWTYFDKNKTDPSIMDSSTDIYYQVAANTPGKINSFYQVWDWYLVSVNYQSLEREVYIGSTINKIYIILAVPQSPWTVEGDTAPWSDILDLCCQVARGESQQSEAARKITQFLYNEAGAVYDSLTHYSEVDGSSTPFQLIRFHDNLPNVSYVNCYDMGKALVTYGNALGCNLTLRYCDTLGDLNCIKPVGRHWNYKKCFNNHAFASIGDYIFDASLKADSLGNPDQKPYRAAWMIDLPWCDYRETVVKKARVVPCNDNTEENNGTVQPPYPQISIFKIDCGRE